MQTGSHVVQDLRVKSCTSWVLFCLMPARKQGTQPTTGCKIRATAKSRGRQISTNFPQPDPKRPMPCSLREAGPQPLGQGSGLEKSPASHLCAHQGLPQGLLHANAEVQARPLTRLSRGCATEARKGSMGHCSLSSPLPDSHLSASPDLWGSVLREPVMEVSQCLHDSRCALHVGVVNHDVACQQVKDISATAPPLGSLRATRWQPLPWT